MIWSAPLTTWLLVTMYPFSLSMITPDPSSIRLPACGKPKILWPPRRSRSDWTFTTAGDTAVVAMRKRAEARFTTPASSSFANASESALARPASQE